MAAFETLRWPTFSRFRFFDALVDRARTARLAALPSVIGQVASEADMMPDSELRVTAITVVRRATRSGTRGGVVGDAEAVLAYLTVEPEAAPADEPAPLEPLTVAEQISRLGLLMHTLSDAVDDGRTADAMVVFSEIAVVQGGHIPSLPDWAGPYSLVK